MMKALKVAIKIAFPLMVVLYLGIAAYGQYRTWDNAITSAYNAMDEIDNMNQTFSADSVICDSLYEIVMRDTSDHRPTDASTKQAINDLLARLYQRQYAIKQLEQHTDSLRTYIKNNEPFWHHIWRTLK